jgi:hypothetical protein
MWVPHTPGQEPDLDRRPASPPPPGPGRDRALLPIAGVRPRFRLRPAVGRSSHCVALSAPSLDGPWSALPRFVLGVGVGGSRDALVHGLVRAGSCVTGDHRPSDLAIAGSGSVAVPAARARVHKDGGNPGPLPGATPRSLIGYRTAPGVQSRARSATSTARSRCCQRITGASWASASHRNSSAAELGMS